MDGFDFTDFNVPTQLSSLNSDDGNESAVLDDGSANGHHHIQSIRNRQCSSPHIRQDLFVGSSSSEVCDFDNIDDSASCASGYYRSRSHSLAFFGEFDVQNLSSSWTSQSPTKDPVHISHVFDPMGLVYKGQRRSSVVGHSHSSTSEPSSPLKIRPPTSNNSGFSSSFDSHTTISLSSEDSEAFHSQSLAALTFHASPRRHSVSLSALDIYQCPWDGCGRVFSRRYNLDTHLRVHTGEKPFSCSFCGLSFARNHDLRRHEKIHVPNRDFTCGACCKKFSRQDALRRHERSNSCCNYPSNDNCNEKEKLLSQDSSKGLDDHIITN